MTRLAFSTNAFKKHPLADAVEAIARLGYAGVEIMADVPHAYPAQFTAEERAALKKQIESLGVNVSNVNAFTLFAIGDTYHPTWIEDDPALREGRVRHTIEAVQLAAELDCPTVSIQPGGPMIGTGLSREEAARRFANGLTPVLEECTRLHITLAIEPEPGLFIQSTQEYRDFKSAFFRDETRVKMNCDVGHLFCVGEDPAESIRSVPSEIAHVHLEDIGKNRVHQHLTPGKGAIDFPSIFAALRDIGYTGWVTVELYPYETTAAGVARAAFEHLKPLLH